VFLDNDKSVEMIYAVFTTPENSIGASAVCAFSLPDIFKAFDGPFKGQTSEEANWLPVPSANVPTPRPATCQSDASHLPDAASVAFHKGHPLMDETVQGRLTLVFASNPDRFRVVEVDHSPEMDLGRAPSPFHIIYIGTESGKVLKVIVDNSQNASRQRRHKADEAENYSASPTPADPLPTFSLNSSLISASWQVSGEPIKTLRLIDSRTLLVGTETQILLLPTNHCAEYKSCRECIHLRDPHCYWDLNTEMCSSMQSIGGESMDQFDLRQDIQNGDTQFCPQGKNQFIRKHFNAYFHYGDGWRESDNLYALESTTPPQERIILEGVQPLAVNGKSEVEKECCPCPVPTETSPGGDFGRNRIPELDGHFRYAGGRPTDYDDEEQTIGKIDASDIVGNEIDRLPRKGKPSLLFTHITIPSQLTWHLCILNGPTYVPLYSNT